MRAVNAIRRRELPYLRSLVYGLRAENTDEGLYASVVDNYFVRQRRRQLLRPGGTTCL